MRAAAQAPALPGVGQGSAEGDGRSGGGADRGSARAGQKGPGSLVASQPVEVRAGR
jgi:hypothetical protein